MERTRSRGWNKDIEEPKQGQRWRMKTKRCKWTLTAEEQNRRWRLLTGTRPPSEILDQRGYRKIRIWNWLERGMLNQKESWLIENHNEITWREEIADTRYRRNRTAAKWWSSQRRGIDTIVDNERARIAGNKRTNRTENYPENHHHRRSFQTMQRKKMRHRNIRNSTKRT